MPSEKKKLVMSILVGLLFFTSDRLIKNLALLNKLPTWLNFQKNYYFLFIFQGWFFYLLTTSILLFLVFLIIKGYKKENYQPSFSLIFILLGGGSNFFDRIIYGFVIDYFNFFNLWSFNLADAMISFGFLSILIYIFQKKK